MSVPAHAELPGEWLTNARRRTTVAIALNLIPFAGIAFLWFLGVVRDRIGEREDRFFATVFLGSGLLFVAARRLLPASAGYLLLGILELIALARYPHQFRWGSAPGVIYLIFVGTILLAGAAGLSRGLRPSLGPAVGHQRPSLPAQTP